MADNVILIAVQADDQASGPLNQIATGALRGLGVAALQMAGDAVQALGQFGATSIQVAGDFEAGMNRLASVAGDSLAAAGFSLDDVREKALQLGAETAFSAAQAQDAMIALAKGGVPIADIMGQATDAALALAAAGELDLAPAADIVAKQLGVWGEAAGGAMNVSNQLAQAANASTVDVDELALGLANVGGVAKVSGVEFNDLVTTMAMIAPGFSSAADAGTSLKTMLLNLSPQTKDAKDAFHDLGLMAFDMGKAAQAMGIDISNAGDPMEEIDAAMRAYVTSTTGAQQGTKAFQKAFGELYAKFEYSKFYDANGSFIGMGQAAELLKTSLNGLSEAEQAAALKAMFGTDAFRAAALMAEGGAAGMDAMAAAMGAAGSATDQAAQRNQGFAFALDSLKGSIETVQIILGSALLPALTNLINSALIPGVNAVMAFAQALLSAANPWQFFLDTLNGVLPGLGTLVGFIADNIIPILAGVAAVITAVVVPAFWAWAFAAETGAVATAMAMLPVIAPIVAIGAAVALLVAAWQNNWFGIQEATAAVWAWLQPILAQLVAWVGAQLPVAIAAASALWTGTLWPALQVVGNFIVGTLWPILQQLGLWLATNIPIAAAAATAAFTAIVDTIVSVATAIQTGLATAITWLSGAWTSVSTSVSTAWASITSTVQGALATVGAVIQTGIAIVTTILQAAWNTAVFLTSAAWNAIVQAVSPAVQAVAQVIGPPIQAAVAGLIGAWNSAAAAAASVWASITGAVSSAAAAIGGVLVSIGAAAASVWASISAAASSAWATITSTISGAVSGVLSVITGAWSSAEGQTGGVWTRIKAIVATAIEGVKAAITTGVTIAKTIVTTAWAVIVAASQNNFDRIPQIIAGAWEKIKSAFSAGVAAVKGIFGEVVSAAAALGGDIVAGIIKGVTSAAGGLFSALKDMAMGALNAAASVLKIGSPSKAFADNVGRWIPEGIGVGVTQAMPALTQGLTRNLGSVVDQAKKTLNAQSMANQVGKPAADGIAQGFMAGVASAKSAIQRGMDGLLDSAKSALQIASPSKRSANEIGAPIIDGIIAGISARSPKAVDAMLDLAGKLFDVVSKGVGAFAELRQLGSVPMSAITQFADAIQFTLEDFSRRVGIWDRAAMSAASQFTAKAGQVVEFLTKGLDLLSGISNLVAPSSSAITQFADALSWTMTEIVRISTYELRLGLMAGVEFAAGAGQIVGVISKGVEALNSLADFVRPAPGVITTFANVLGWLVSRIVLVAQWIGSEGIGAAATFADGAGKVLAIVSTGVDAFLKLGTFVKPPAGVTQQFANMVGWLVSRIVEVANWIGARGTTSAAAFADGAGKVLAIVSTGVDAFLKLGTFVKPPAGVTQQFANMVGWLVSRIVEVANWIGQRATAAAATFADGAGRVLGLIKTGVDGLNALRDLQPVSDAAVLVFANAIDFVVWIMSMVAADMSVEAAEAAAAFSESAGKVVGLLKTGVDGLNALADLGPVSSEAVLAFANAIDFVVWIMSMVAADMSVEAAEAAAAFSESAGKVIGILKSGVDGLNALADLGPVSSEAVLAFANAIDFVVWIMSMVAADMSVEAAEAAAAFSESAGKVIGILKSGVDGFLALADLQPVAAGAIQRFVALVNTLVTDIAAASESFSADALAQAQKFAQSAGAAVGILEKGVRGLLEVDTFAGVSEAAIGRFADGVRLAVAAMARLATEFGPEATAAAKAFAQAAGESTDFLKKGADGLNKVGEFQAVPVAGLKIFADGIKQLVKMVLDLSLLITAQMLADAVRFAIGIDQVIQVVGGGLKAFKDLAIAADNTKAFLTSFSNAVKTLMADFKSAAIPAATELGTTISATIGAGLTAGSAQVVAGLSAVAQAISTWLGAHAPILASAGLTLGQQIGIGLANGLISTIPWIVQAAIAAASAAVLAAQQTLGIASPSKVFGKLGSFAGQGLAGGMDAEQANVAGAGAGLARSATLGTVSSLPTPSANTPTTSMSSRSVTLQVAPGAIVVHGAPGQSEQQIATSALDRLQELARMAATS